jgi:hypothetical protein
MTRMIWGRVTFENGSVPTAEVVVELVCRGSPLPVGHLDTHGKFQFHVGNPTPGVLGGGVARVENGCVLQAALAGYRSSQVFVRDPDAFETLEVGTVVLYPITEGGGPTVSTKTLQIPPKAQKAYDNALKELGKQRPNSEKSDSPVGESGCRISPIRGGLEPAG